ncbi:MAG: hypothetical protein GY856_20065 [bacterium]|nr:hypothetical protein [bacterium]
MSSLEALWRAWRSCRRGKRRQPRIAAFDLDADTYLCRLHRQLCDGSYRPSGYRLRVIYDPKKRLVAAPALIDRVVHNALLTEIGPTYEPSFIDQSYACCTGRGPHRAVLAYLAASRRYRFRLALDVDRYFASIDRRILCGLFARRLRDPRTRELIVQLIEAGGRVYRTPLAAAALDLHERPLAAGCGLPLGSYLSHWSGSLYLDGLDHFVKRTLKVRAYQRYMDDMTLFHDDATFLEDAREAMREWLRRERRLELKRRRDHVEPTSQPGTYLGFRVSRSGVLPGPKAKRRLKRRLREADSLGIDRLARSLCSYRGMLMSI